NNLQIPAVRDKNVFAAGGYAELVRIAFSKGCLPYRSPIPNVTGPHLRGVHSAWRDRRRRIRPAVELLGVPAELHCANIVGLQGVRFRYELLGLPIEDAEVPAQGACIFANRNGIAAARCHPASVRGKGDANRKATAVSDFACLFLRFEPPRDDASKSEVLLIRGVTNTSQHQPPIRTEAKIINPLYRFDFPGARPVAGFPKQDSAGVSFTTI